MTVQPRAATHHQSRTALTVAERGQARSNPSNLRDHVNVTRTKTHNSQRVIPTERSSSAENPQPSGDVRIDGYTLWAFSDVFKGLVLDVRL